MSEQWEVVEEPNEYVIFNGERGTSQFAVAYVPKYAAHDSAEHARLVAAAPELLGTLKLMVASCPVCEGLGEIEDGPEYLLPIGEYTQDYMSCPHCSDARQAIAKARGEEHP